VPRRQQRRPAFRPRKSDRSGAPVDTAVLDAGARRVLDAHGHDVTRLQALVRDLQQLRDEADRLAFEEPSPDALREYRRADRELAEAKRALTLAGGVD
jgi:hypothetical protein